MGSKTMDISDRLLGVFSQEIEALDDEYVIAIPEREIDLGDLEPGDVYRIGMFSPAGETASDSVETSDRDRPVSDRQTRVPDPPVSDGEHLEVEIEDTGDKGDGIARVDRGYIVFVPDTDIGDRVTIEITDVRENFAFGEVVDW